MSRTGNYTREIEPRPNYYDVVQSMLRSLQDKLGYCPNSITMNPMDYWFRFLTVKTRRKGKRFAKFQYIKKKNIRTHG
jgi:hypothetical protein